MAQYLKWLIIYVYIIIFLDMKENFDYNEIIEKFPWILERDRNFVISPDADGFYCAMLLTYFLNWRCVGFYNDRVLLLKNGIEENDVVFVDVEMFDKNKMSIGNHALLPKNIKKFEGDIYDGFSQCLNLNLHRKVSHKYYESKYPFGTSHLILSILSFAFKNNLSEFLDTPEKLIAFTYADGMLKNINNYPENASEWRKYMMFDEEWNPFRKLYSATQDDLEKGRIAFHKKIKGYTKKGQRGDRLTLTNHKGDLEACYANDSGLYGIKNDNKDSIVGFLKMVHEIFDIDYDESSWDCWDNLSLTRYKKVRTKTGNKYFGEMLSKSILSYAVTRTDCLEYTLKNDESRDVSTEKKHRGRPLGWRKSPEKYAIEYGGILDDIKKNGLSIARAAQKYGKSATTISRAIEVIGEK